MRSAIRDSTLLLLYPGATASVLAGVNALPVRRFLPLLLTGIVLAALLTRLLAAAAAGPLAVAAATLMQWTLPADLLLLALTVLAPLLRRRRTAGLAPVTSRRTSAAGSRIRPWCPRI